MADIRTLLERGYADATPPPDGFERLRRRHDRKRRNQRIAAAVVGISVTLLTLASLVRAFGTVERPADQPTPSPKGIFADVGGWIAYGNEEVKQGPLGVWAVDPTRPNDPAARIKLSDRPRVPLAWSSDGSKLLLWRFRDLGKTGRVVQGSPTDQRGSWMALFVLNADGTETRVVTNNPKLGGGSLGGIAGGSFSPDGSQVVFATYDVRAAGIYTVDSDGGTPQLVLATGIGPDVFAPAFSPDGTQIAYFGVGGLGGLGKGGFSPRIMNADGTGVRVLTDVCGYYPSLGGPAWSPDGSHIAFNCEREVVGGELELPLGTDMWVVGADGSGLTRMPDGRNPYWSPDGSRIAFELPHQGNLAIANADGTHVQVFGYPAHAGPWNPWPSAVPGEPNSTATAGEVSPFVYAVVALGVVGVLVLVWRARRSTAAQ
jgi:WD40-like Beta Propeller Repeat